MTTHAKTNDDYSPQSAHGRRSRAALYILTRRASAAEFSYKPATGQDPTHPVNVRGQEAIDRIREATGGRLEIKAVPRQPTRPDTELFDPVCNGGVEFLISPRRSSQPCSRRGYRTTGFAFTNYESVW